MKRLVAGPLWFISFALMYELLWSFTGVPRILGPAIGLVVAATVWMDPMHWFWAAAPNRLAGSMPAPTFQTSAK